MTHTDDDVREHLATIPQTEWARLFDLLPAIAKTEKFGEWKGGKRRSDGAITLPFCSIAEVVSRFLQIVYDLGLIIPFDWGAWDEGRAMLAEKDYNRFDAITLCKLMTAIVRNDRFCEGVLVEAFEDGIMPRLIAALKNKYFVEASGISILLPNGPN